MVYYYTSQNFKLIKNIVNEFTNSVDITPKEFIDEYVKNCPLKIEDVKLTWIVDTFLGIQKHASYLYEVLGHLSEFVKEEDKLYFVIALFAITFQITSKDMDLLYKCLFNLSKSLLHTFTSFMSNNESLSYISDVAQTCYDSKYVTEKIVCPLFAWQPYISEMAHNYALYLREIENRKYKPPTVPVQPNFVKRPVKAKEASTNTTTSAVSEPSITAKEPLKKTRPLTKSAIDNRLKKQYEQNKAKAEKTINIVKKDNYRYQIAEKSEKYNQLIENMKEEMEEPNQFKFVANTKPVLAPRCQPAKDTRLTLKRLDKNIEKVHQKEMEWLDFLVKSSHDPGIYEEKLVCSRLENEQNRLVEIEKRHLMGQLSYEEAVIAKQKIRDDNKRKRAEFEEEKKKWHEEIDTYKKRALEKNLELIQKMSLQQLKLYEVKHNLFADKKENAKKIRASSEGLKSMILQNKREELERCAAMIHEIKVLRSIAKQAKIPRVIDLTESAGFGLLCEMSIAELSERLVQVKIALKDELISKRNEVREKHEADHKNYIQTKQNVDLFLEDRKRIFENRSKEKLILPAINAKVKRSKEISELKKLLEEKRLLRQRKEAMMSQPYY